MPLGTIQAPCFRWKSNPDCVPAKKNLVIPQDHQICNILNGWLFDLEPEHNRNATTAWFFGAALPYRHFHGNFQLLA